MKREVLFDLVKSAFEGDEAFNRYLFSFIDILRAEKQLDLAKRIELLQGQNQKARLQIFHPGSKILSLDNFSEKIMKEAELIKMTYEKGFSTNVILHGKPGTGKTTFARKFASSINLPLHQINPSDVLDPKLGASIIKFENLFDKFSSERSVIFIDEADSFFRKRGSSNDVFEGDRILTSALRKIDSLKNSILILSTNLLNSLDTAILRRMDVSIDFNKNDPEGLVRIFLDNLQRYGFDDRETNKIQKICDKIRSHSDILTISDTVIIAKKISMSQILNVSPDRVFSEYINDAKTKETRR